jgi:RIO kinase 2
VENLAEAFLKLTDEDLVTLKGIEIGMRRYEWVPTTEISRISGLDPSKAEYRLDLLNGMGLVARETLHYLGYQIDFPAYDLLALDELVRRDAVICIGPKLGVGKESVVYEALGPEDLPLAVKFHREGRTSFKRVRRLREHLKGLPRFSWLYASALAARHEFQVMDKLYPQVSVPRPVAHSRHALVMERACGIELSRANIQNPEEAMGAVLDEVAKAYSLKVIHADLSEFNIFVSEGGVEIIDWPQAVSTDHPNAAELVERDVANVLRFFERKYKIKADLAQALSRIRREPLKEAA